jgi:hypothetical protein
MMQKSRRSITDLILHLHPSTVPEETLRLTLSWGLGGMAVVQVCLLFLTGILLLLTAHQSQDLPFHFDIGIGDHNVGAKSDPSALRAKGMFLPVLSGFGLP